MKYCIVEICLVDEKLVAQIRSSGKYIYTDNIKSKDVIWYSKDEASRLCKIMPGTAMLPKSLIK